MIKKNIVIREKKVKNKKVIEPVIITIELGKFYIFF